MRGLRLACAMAGAWILTAGAAWGGPLDEGRGTAADYAAAPGTAHATLACGDCHVSIPRDTDAYSYNPAWRPFRTPDRLPVFRLYRSPTFDALGPDISQPDGTSKLCLGCHDGSYPGLARSLRDGHNFGPDDLVRSHPVSFTYDSGLAMRARTRGLRDPSMAPSGFGGTVRKDLLDDRGRMQCTSCHTPHASAVSRSLLRYQYSPTLRGGSAFCTVCHEK